jgi:hypothetical protein
MPMNIAPDALTALLGRPSNICALVAGVKERAYEQH